MAINLHTKYAKKIAAVFTQESIMDGRLSSDYDLTGVKSVKISTPVTVPLNDYQRSGTSRYGTPTEIQDVVQELTMSQDKSFTATVDKGNQSDQQGTKAAGRMMGLQIKERVVPVKDKYTLGVLSQKAGKIVGSSTALSKTNVIERIAAGVTALDDAEVPQTDRTLYLPSGTFSLVALSNEFIGVDKLAEKSLGKFKVGELLGMDVVRVPAGRWPANVNFIIVYKNSALAPVKISEAKLHQDPPGISGNLLEGRFYFDAFVIGAKADGVYVEVNTASDGGTVLAAPTIAAATGAITAASGATAVYTLDGSDPRYSISAKTGATTGATAGQVVKAYQYKEGSFPSPVAEVTVTG